MSKLGVKGLCAAKEWIDQFCGDKRPKEDFPWYTYDKLYPDLVDRSLSKKIESLAQPFQTSHNKQNGIRTRNSLSSLGQIHFRSFEGWKCIRSEE